MAVGQSQFPTALDDAQSLIQVANDSSTTLSAAATASDTTLTVGDTASFPASGTLVIEDEILYYTGKTATTFTGVTRAQEGTAAATHALGLEVQGLITARHHAVLSDALIAVETKIGVGAETLPAQIAALEARIATLEAGTSGAGNYTVSAYGASGSKATFTGAISLSTPTSLLLTAAGDFAVGQGVYIAGAGAAAAALITKVTAVSADKRTFTLQNAASTAVTTATVQHDDTVAIQAAIQACFDAGGGEVLFDAGFYRVNGPVNPATESLLYIPHNQYSEAPEDAPNQINMSITLRGRGPVLVPVVGRMPNSTVIQTDQSHPDLDVSILNCGKFVSLEENFDYSGVNYIALFIDSITFQLYDNPQISGLDCGMAFNVSLRNILIYTGLMQNIGAEPTTQHFGLRTPRGRFCTVCYVENVCVANFWYGAMIAELVNANQLTVFACKVGIEKTWGDHLNFGMLCLVQNATQIHFVNGGLVDFTISSENLGSAYAASLGQAWKGLVKHFDDPLNTVIGRIGYINFFFEPAYSTPPAIITGCSKVVFTDYGSGEVRMGAADVAALEATNATIQTFDVTGAATLGGPVNFSPGGELMPMSFGANDSAGPDYRQLRVPNTGGEDLDEGLVGYWKLEEGDAAVRQDAVGSLAMTCVGTAAAGPGKVGNGFRCFGATPAYLTTADSPVLDFSAASGLSIVGWIYLASITTPYTLPSIITKYGLSDGSLDFALLYNSLTSDWTFSITSLGTGASQVNCLLNQPAALSTWYFVAAVWDGASDQMRLSVNDGTPAVVSFAGPVYHSNHALEIGRFNDQYQTNGVIDEVALYNRALLPSEVTSLFNSGAGRTPPFS